MDIVYPGIIEASDLFDLVLALHKEKHVLDKDGLHRMIRGFDCYALRRVSLGKLSVFFASWSNDPDVLNYSKMDPATSPPIVLGYIDATTGNYTVSDGNHRAASHFFLGLPDILAYVPVV